MSFKYIIKLFAAYLKRFKAVILVTIPVGILLFLILNYFLPKLSQNENQIVGVAGRFRPNELPNDILLQISSGLTKINDSLIEPDIAESWESPDKGKTWIFKLKDNIYWQDGTKIRSTDIAYEFSDVSVERPDDATIIFTLEKGTYSPFPSVLTKPVFKKGLLGTGEWNVKKISISNTFVQEMILESGENTKHYKFYPTVEQTKLAYKLGKIDKIEKILDPSPFLSWNNTSVIKYFDNDQIVTIFFNTQDKLLAEKSVRQALFYAINKSGFEKKAESPINPESWAYNPQLKDYDYDMEKAKQLLDKLPDELKNDLQIKLVSTPSLLSSAEEIAKDWQAVGINTQILVSSIIPQEYQAFLTILDLPDDPDQYPFWHSTQTSTNISKYVNPRIDKLLEDGRIELNLEERRKQYLDFQRFLLEDLPAAFLYHPVYYDISRKTVF